MTPIDADPRRTSKPASDPNPTVPAIEPPFTSRRTGEDPDEAAIRVVAAEAERQRDWEEKLSQL
jgi:hypothetical protein